MSKNLICIVSKQLLPNYLFIKEFAKAGDKVFFIATKKSDDGKNILWDVIKKDNSLNIELQTVPLYGLEEKWVSMLARLPQYFDKKEDYLINLTGGTKYIAQAVYEYFRDCPSAEFCYIPFPKNECLDYRSDSSTPIKTRLSLEEYFELCGLTYQKEVPFLFKEYKDYAYQFFNKFITFTDQDKEAITLMRDICENQYKWNGIADDSRVKAFLQKIEFPLTKEMLDEKPEKERKKYLKYIAGGWFEEYVRARLTAALGVPFYGIKNLEVKNASKDNELDCVGVLNNHCLVGECKTVLVWSNVEKWVESALDKANRINKNIISALSAHSYLFYLDIHGNEAEIKKSLSQAENLKLIKAFGKEYFTDDAKFAEMINIIKENLGYQNAD